MPNEVIGYKVDNIKMIKYSQAQHLDKNEPDIINRILGKKRDDSIMSAAT